MLRNKKGTFACRSLRRTFRLGSVRAAKDRLPKDFESLVCLGQALLSEGQYDSARKTLSEGVALGSRNLGENDQVMILALNALGTLEQRTGHFDAARSNFERMIYSACCLWSYQLHCCSGNL